MAHFAGRLAETWAPGDPHWVRAGQLEPPCLVPKGRPGGRQGWIYTVRTQPRFA